jgi:hypothetical protein
MSAGMLILGVAGSGSVVAQPIYVAPPPGYVAIPPGRIGPPPAYRPGLSPQAVAAIVRSAGLVPVARPVRRGPRRYVVFATNTSRQRLRVIVDAHDGRILQVSPVFAARPGPRVVYGYPPPPAIVPMPQRAGPPPIRPEIKDPLPQARSPREAVGGPIASSRNVPTPRIAAVPRGTNLTSTPTARSRTTPLPRPRPALAANVVAPTPAPLAAPQAMPAPEPAAESKPAPAAGTATATESKAPELVPVAPLE